MVTKASFQPNYIFLWLWPNRDLVVAISANAQPLLSFIILWNAAAALKLIFHLPERYGKNREQFYRTHSLKNISKTSLNSPTVTDVTGSRQRAEIV